MMKCIDEFELKDKRVLCRFDYNVPLDESQNIVEDSRIKASLPTINHALSEGAKVIIASHLGRPKGKRVPELSLAPVARRLSQLLSKDVKFLPDCIGDDVRREVEAMSRGDVIVLENLRFYKEETDNEDKFARQLASLADVYINDAFGNAHRSHASNVGIVRHVKECGIGFLMKKELEYFSKALENPVRPLVAVLGGSKVSEKLGAVENLSRIADKIIVGGGMAYTFLKAMDIDVGRSIVEEDLIDDARRGMEQARDKGVKLYFPVDTVAASKIDLEADFKIVTAQEIPPDLMGLDIGPATAILFKTALENARTVVWNGPMGVFELEPFAKGTYAVARAIGRVRGLTIIGGGDTDAAVRKAGEEDNVTFISTGGGAFLWLLQGKKLPSVLALEEKEQAQT